MEFKMSSWIINSAFSLFVVKYSSFFPMLVLFYILYISKRNTKMLNIKLQRLIIIIIFFFYKSRESIC